MPENTPPNIILILADDMGFSDSGCFGGEIDTPNLDRLGFGGCRMTQLYNSSRCCPTRASLLTGLCPQQAGVGHMVDDWNAGPAYRGWLRDDTVTIAEALKAGGYQTCYSGKWHVNWSFEPAPGEAVDSLHHHLGEPGYPHPMQRGFDDVYALMAGATSLFNPDHLIRQDQWVKPEQPGYYITDAITDHAIDMIDRSVTAEQPFFLHLNHIAPHWPLHALPEDIAKYKNHYVDGWDAIRLRRHQRLQELGIIDPQWQCSPRDEQAPDWQSLSAQQQAWEASRMAVYAAMIDRLDQSTGRLMNCVEKHGMLDNTVVIFLSDNGGSAEFLKEDGWCKWYDQPTWDGRQVRLGNDINIQPGSDDTFMSYDLPWANASNTPFRLFKHFVHEGGISTPAIIAGPGIQAGHIDHSPCHVMDIMPTILELAGVECPAYRDGQAVQQPEGDSFVKALMADDWQRDEPVFLEHEGNCAVRNGRWKAVRQYPEAWELYDMHNDRTELHDLATRYPQILADMQQQYQQWATRAGVRDWPPGPWPQWMDSDEFRAG